MASRIVVDHSRLRSGATEVEGMAESVARSRTGLVDPLVSAEAHLAGASSGAQVAALFEAVVVAAAEARAWWLGR